MNLKDMYNSTITQLAHERMEKDGIYLTFYPSLDTYIDEQLEWDYTKDEINAYIEANANLEELEEGFIMLESQGSEGFYWWNQEHTVNDIIDFFKDDYELRNYVQATWDIYSDDFKTPTRISDYDDLALELDNVKDTKYVHHYVFDDKTETYIHVSTSGRGY